ncbi:hypothetical protein FNV43_RR01148 [Rhamnella rubrinervis]|uniref:ALOG domain-containing protein n=1 Tax=Rhamnella rubrinervis TaxID=2594499 RepID=A0A8K0HP40_9ROSA|nr:hypothetical protein FNV43_RR01148 [Rhamnella rubrinervis]
MDSLQEFETNSNAESSSININTNTSAISSSSLAAPGAVASSSSSASSPTTLSRYENQKRRDWNTFDQFGKTKVHTQLCPFYGHPNPPAPCPCPLRQAWGSLDALIGRLRAAFEEHARAVRLYLREVRDSQAKARGISYEKKKRKRPPQPPQPLQPPPPPPPAPAANEPLL